MTPQDLFDQARDGLLANRLRALLSGIGIVVGVGTVIASLAIGEGARRAAINDIGALGIDNLYARSVDRGHDPKATLLAPELTRGDAETIRAAIDGVSFVSSSRWTRQEITADADTSVATIAGVTANWSAMANIPVAEGRVLSGEDERSARRVAVVGQMLAQRLGHGRPVLGQRLTINGLIVEIVGVLASVERGTGARALQPFNPDEALIMPVSVMDARLGEGDSLDRVSEIGVHVAAGTDADRVGSAMAALLQRRHPGQRDRYELVLPRELLRTRLRAQRTFDAVLLATGFIALIISGVGIMNIMLAAIAERTMEIGVRRALGARRIEIVQQFALEAALLCLVGGFTGVSFGATLAWVVSLLAGWPVAVSAPGVSMAMLLAGTVGLGFGVYPAYLAASIDPIQALRA